MFCTFFLFSLSIQLINIYYQIQSEKIVNMNIDIKFKLRSLLRRRQKFYCLSYDWDTRQIMVHKQKYEYQNQIGGLQKNGIVKRAECYHDEPILAENNKIYLLYLVSYGDFRKAKMVRGENPIAKGLGICMFDFVYLFLEQFHQVQKNIESRMVELDRKGLYFQRNLMIEVHCKFFREKQETSFSTLNSSVQCSNKQQQKEESFSV